MEKWKVCPSWDRFEISNKGNIRHTSNKIPKYLSISKSGYYVLQARLEGKIFSLKLHRLVAETWLTPPSEDLVLSCQDTHHCKVCVNHKDGNKLNNNPDNLEWCSHEHNVQHAYTKNLIPPLKGSLNGRSKLTEEDVHNICRMLESGTSIKEVLSLYPNTSRSQISKIRAGLAWNHIRDNYNIKVNKRSTKFND